MGNDPRHTLKMLQQKTQYWKQFRPELHKKTFFKGATSLTMGVASSLNLKDETAREIVKDAFKIVGEELPEQSLEERMRTRNKQVTSEEFIAIDDLDEEEDQVVSVEPRSRMVSKVT